MVAFNFRVITDDGRHRITVLTAGKVMVDIQSLLTEIGEHLIVREMCLAGPAPFDLLSRFTLCIDDMSESIVTSADLRSETPGTLMDSAISCLGELLDHVGSSDVKWIAGNFPDPLQRAAIMGRLLSLSADLEGFGLEYGTDRMRRFLPMDFVALDPCLHPPEKYAGSVMGIVLLSPDGRPFLSGRGSDVQLDFDGSMKEEDVLPFSEKGPCLVKGNVNLRDGRISKVSEIERVDTLPYLSFRRIINAERDVLLSEHVSADVDFDRDTGVWTLSNEMLGVSISKGDLDRLIAEFHDHFLFMWEMYAEGSGDDLDEGEVSARDYLLSLTGPGRP